MKWTERITQIIFYALFATVVYSTVFLGRAGDENVGVQKDAASDKKIPLGENEKLRIEIEMLRREFSEVLLKSEMQNKEFLRIDLGLASALAGDGTGSRSEDVRRLVESFKTLSTDGRDLALKVLDLCEYVESSLEKPSLDDIARIRIKSKIEDVRKANERFNSLLKDPGEVKLPEKCRILSVNSELNAAVLDVGSSSGISCGLICKAEKADGSNVLMNIVAVRPFISAAILTKGEISEIAPGTTVNLGNVSR